MCCISIRYGEDTTLQMPSWRIITSSFHIVSVWMNLTDKFIAVCPASILSNNSLNGRPSNYGDCGFQAPEESNPSQFAVTIKWSVVNVLTHIRKGKIHGCKRIQIVYILINIIRSQKHRLLVDSVVIKY